MDILTETVQKRGVTVEILLSPDLPTVTFDAIRMEQMIINFALNAVQASSEGEKVTIRTSMAKKNIVIDVADYGSGISHDHRAKVFDPFFTSKKEGTGLGLAIVKKLVEAHERSLEISDNSPHGTIFSVILPRQ